MTDEKLKIAIYSQNCQGIGGGRCHDPESYGEDWDENPDLDVYEGTQEELLAEADRLRELGMRAAAGPDQHYLRSSRSLREAVE